MIKIPYNKPVVLGQEFFYIKDAIERNKFSGDGYYTKECESWLEKKLNAPRALLVPSCTAALEMAAILCDIKPGDEVIMPSFTFVSTANAFLLRGARIVFVDVDPDSMSIDPKAVQEAVTSFTKAIVVVHYAGATSDIKNISNFAKSRNIFLIEDAAQSLLSTYDNEMLGTFGDFATISFHETKNLHCGEGGALIINNKQFVERAEIIREKGTNRSKFFRGEVDKYTWVDVGSSYLLGELSAAFLYAQLLSADDIIKNRVHSWQTYYRGLGSISQRLSKFSNMVNHNGHIFYIKCDNLNHRQAYVGYMKERGVSTVFHYVPLHSTDFGRNNSSFSGKDNYTTFDSERLIRLPIFYNMTNEELNYVINNTLNFFNE